LILATAAAVVLGLTGPPGANAAPDSHLPLGRQVLPANDGWAAEGTGTTGGSAAPAENVHTVHTRAELVAALAAPAPKIIQVSGTIDGAEDDAGGMLSCDAYATGGYTLESYLATYDPAVWGRDREPAGPLEDARVASAANQTRHIKLKVSKDTTIVGLGSHAVLKGLNLHVDKVNNVIIRNLNFVDAADCFPQWDPTDGATGAWNSLYDNVSLTGATHVWVDHNTFTDGNNPDSGLPRYFGEEFQVHDGELDITNASNFVTASWNKFLDHDKTMLIGSSNTSTTDPGKLNVTVHHNLFGNTLQRLPRVRFGQVHVYNNFYVIPDPSTFVYALGVGVQSKLFAESNAFALGAGIDPAGLLFDWSGTTLTARNNVLQNGLRSTPVDLIGVYNAAHDPDFGTDAGWTPTLHTRIDSPRAVPFLVPIFAGSGRVFGAPESQVRPAALTETTAPQQVERLDRGLISMRSGDGNFLSWRLLATDEPGTSFNVYRDGRKVNVKPLTVSNFRDAGAPAGATYTVRPVVGGVESASVAAEKPSMRFDTARDDAGILASSMDVPIQVPGGGTTPDGVSFTYTANDASVADLDGDGQLEIVLKWDPTNSKDNSQDGYTGNVFVDAYKLNGQRLWRIDLGRNIRAGAHYTQFQVFDYDGDGRAEVVMKTADATRSGTGQVIGNASADFRNSAGRILSGPEFLTVFRGTDGAILATADFVPARGTVSSWGDSYGNRVDRFLAGTAFVDGSRPSIIMARGYYTRTVIVAWDWRNGALTRRWTFDSNSSTNGSAWTGQGNHQLSIADVDADGRDEIIYGSMAVNDNGSGLWVNGLGHGDTLHVGDLVPGRPGLEMFKPDENTGSPADWVADARTGQTLWRSASCGCDNGRGVAADIWSGNPGAEVWSSAVGGLRSASSGAQLSSHKPSSTNFVIWWDGDATRELLDGTHIDKYGTGGDTRLLTASGVHSNNGTKSTPSLAADILGDWREEVIWPTSDNRALRIFSTTDPTSISHVSLLQDRQYREAVAWQNTAYNQPPHPSFRMG
jgi:pectate lyase